MTSVHQFKSPLFHYVHAELRSCGQSVTYSLYPKCDFENSDPTFAHTGKVPRRFAEAGVPDAEVMVQPKERPKLFGAKIWEMEIGKKSVEVRRKQGELRWGEVERAG